MAELASEENESRITKVLSQAPARGFTIGELSDKAGLSRATICKYLVGLEAKEVISVEKVGQSKLITLVKGD